MAEKSESGVMLRSMFFGTVLMGLFVVLSIWLDGQAAAILEKFDGQMYGGFILFFLWMTVAWTLRGATRANAGIDAWRLLLIGVFIAVVGTAIGSGLNQVAAQYQENWITFEISGQSMLFYAGMGLIASIIALINLRIGNKLIGNLLEFAVIAGLIYAFYRFML